MAKNLKIGDLVEVKFGCSNTPYTYWSPDMRLYEGKQFTINRLNVDGDGVHELSDISKGQKYLDVSDWTFDEAWLKKVKPAVKIIAGITGASITPIATKPKDERQFAMIKSGTGCTIILDGTTYNLQSDHINYVKIMDKIKAKDYDLESLINISKSVEEFGEGKLSVKDGVVKYNGSQLHGCIVDSILGLIKDGFSVEPIVKFLDNLSKNPSYRAQTELYGFLEYGKLPITDDGCFLTYKKIRKDWKDIHSGTFDNSIGAVCEMPRHKVDDNSNNTCSAGLHVCSYEYTKSFGGSDSRLVLCKVNPADVVSIPVDYNDTKMRCCKYVVVAEVQDKSDVLKGVSLYKV